MIYGWTPKECLKMQARTFFSMLKEGKRFKELDRLDLYRQFTNIVMCAHTSHTYYKELSEHYQTSYDFLTNPDQKRFKGPVFEADDPELGRQLLSLAKQKMRLEGLH